MKSKNEKVQFLRLCLIDEEIRRGTFPTAKQLAKKLEVSERTVLRDMDFLQLLKCLLPQYKNTPMQDCLNDLFEKISTDFSPSTNEDNRTQFLSKYLTYISDSIPVIDVNSFNCVFKSLAENKKISFEYHSLKSSEYEKRTAEPYHIVFQKGNWYFIGFCDERSDIRTFSFSRIENASVTNQSYKMPENFKAKKYFDAEFGVWANETKSYKVKLRFEGKSAIFAKERFFCEGQTTNAKEYGSVEVIFETTQITEVERLVLSQGENCTVLEPEILREKVAKSAEKIVKKYLV